MKKILILIIMISLCKANPILPVEDIYYIYSEDKGNTWHGPFLVFHNLKGFGAYSYIFRLSFVADFPKIYIPLTEHSLPFFIDTIKIFYSYNSSIFESKVIGIAHVFNFPMEDTTPRISITSYDMDTVFIVWEDMFSIKFSSSFDSCLTWRPETVIFGNLSSTPQPCIKYFPPYLHLVWRNNNLIYYSRSMDYGNTWSTPVAISNVSSPKRCPEIDVKGNFIAVCWQDFRNGKSDLYYNFSIDTGNTWFDVDICISDTGDNFSPDIKIDSTYVYTGWSFESGNTFRRGFGKSADSGITWIKNFGDSLPISDKFFVSITSKYDTIYATHSEMLSWEYFPSKLFYSDDGGETWIEKYDFYTRKTHMEIILDKMNYLHICYGDYYVNIKETYKIKSYLNNKNIFTEKEFKNYIKFSKYSIFDLTGKKIKNKFKNKIYILKNKEGITHKVIVF